MTETNKRTNSAKSVLTINGAEAQTIAEKLNALMAEGATVYNFNDIMDSEGNLIDYGNNYNFVVIPQYDATNKDKLAYYMIGFIPTFDALLNDKAGKEYLSNQYDIRTIKRIRDNQRLAIADGRQFVLATNISDFVAVSRAGTGISDIFKKLVAELTKALQKKFEKLPQAKMLLSQKTVLTALNNEAFAQKYLPFCVKADGKSIFGKWLELQIANLEKDGKPTADLQNILQTRETAELDDFTDEENASELDELF